MKEEHICKDLEFANGYNEFFISIDRYKSDLKWCVNIENKCDDENYFYKTIESIKYCPFCGSKL